MVYLAKGGFWLGLGQVITSISIFFLSLAFANLISPETYGDYKYILSIVGLLAVANLQGINTALVRSIAQGYDGSAITALKTKLKWGVLGGLASLALSIYYFFQGNTVLANSLLIASVFLPFMDSFSIFSGLLYGKKLFKLGTGYSNAIQISSVMVMITVLFFTKNILFIVLAYFLTNTAFRLIFLVILFKKFISNKKEDPGMVSYGKHLSLIKGISSIFGNLNNIFLFHFIGGLGLLFSLLYADRANQRFVNGETLFMPKLSEEGWKISKFSDFLKKALPFISIILAGTIIYIILAPIFYKLLFPKYLASIFFSRLLALTWIFTAINIIYSAILKGKRKIREQYIINAIDIGIGIFITLPMIYLFGIYGLVYSILINKVVDFLLMSILLFQKQSLQVE